MSFRSHSSSLNILRANLSLFTAGACPSDAYAKDRVERISIRDFGLTDFRPAEFELPTSFESELIPCVSMMRPKETKQREC